MIDWLTDWLAACDENDEDDGHEDDGHEDDEEDDDRFVESWFRCMCFLFARESLFGQPSLTHTFGGIH